MLSFFGTVLFKINMFSTYVNFSLSSSSKWNGTYECGDIIILVKKIKLESHFLKEVLPSLEVLPSKLKITMVLQILPDHLLF